MTATKLFFGDRVIYRIGTYEGSGVVIGFPAHLSNDEMVILSDDKYHGMPIQSKWCQRLRRPDLEKAKRLRERYVKLYPGFLRDEN